MLPRNRPIFPNLIISVNANKGSKESFKSLGPVLSTCGLANRFLSVKSTTDKSIKFILFLKRERNVTRLNN